MNVNILFLFIFAFALLQNQWKFYKSFWYISAELTETSVSELFCTKIKKYCKRYIFIVPENFY